MGKRIRVQRRGRGSSTFRANTQKRIAKVQYPNPSKETLEGAAEGQLLRLYHESGRGSPLGLVELKTGQSYYTVVPEGVYEGQNIVIGIKAPVDIGNVIPLGNIPEGTMICDIELSPGDGGKMARSSGTYATVVGHTPQGTIIKLPSGKTRYLNDRCRATVGVMSAAGRNERPFLKAGTKFHLMQAKGRVYPRTRGLAMVSAVHPYGSSKRGGRKVTTVARGAPPGQKVGLIAARSTGRGRRKTR